MSAPDIVDAAERARALDPRLSCIVQAPAGSGKTGLLIQRVLRLLASVERPEEILAITFTRKAAAEMRRRVLEALSEARAVDPGAPDAHTQLTRELAREALARDAKLGWHLLENPSRLRVQTIDALCASLASQMPVLSRLGATFGIVEDAREHYREAAERTLDLLEQGGALAAALRRILLRLDGDRAAARALIVEMLAHRDQWLWRARQVGPDPSVREGLERALRAERSRILRRAHTLMPRIHEEMLSGLLRHAAAHAAEGSAVPAIFARCAGYPGTAEDDVAAWLCLADLLLVKDDGQMRKRVDKRQGFPPSRPGERQAAREMSELLESLAGVPGLCEALHALRRMPPAAFDEAQWEALSAIVAILPQAAAQLELVFAAHGEIDFTGLAQAAVAALGEPDAPTDLLLAMDLRVGHLLVDEFQDTSRSQWELLERLTAGWTPGDGRTVFLVGDPMQSIYRFRDADVALYLRAREEGLPQVALEAVRLATNFRSHQGLVDWLNTAFARILPRAEDAESGAVPHAPSSAFHPRREGPAVQWHPFIGRDAEAARLAEARKVVEIVRDSLASGRSGTVAILVRGRSHLDRISESLRVARIPFRAVDVEPLASRPLVQDLLAIARALAHEADRVAWLALLRAPWCALTVAELHALAGDETAARETVWSLMGEEARLARLGADGSERVRRVRERLTPFVRARGRGSLRERVEGAWLALGGPATAAEATELEDAEAFFDQLDALEQGGDLTDPARLETRLSELYSASAAAREARLSVMTIHKAKGLEFDTVIVPGLDRPPPPPTPPPFAWRARADGTLLAAPLRAAGESRDAAYDYLLAEDRAAAEHELQRMLYVAATRAIRRLHLLGFARVQEKEGGAQLKTPARGSLLACAWDVAHAAFEEALAAPREAAASTAPSAERSSIVALAPALLELRAPEPTIPARPAIARREGAVEFSWAGETARLVGTVAHRWLQRIAADGVQGWDASRVRLLRPRIAASLVQRGLPEAERAAACERVLQVLEGAVTDERGRWLLRTRADARSEYRLRVAGPAGVSLAVIDRTFVEDGRRWIVDFKTGGHEGGGLERFLDREADRYRAQLTGYASAFPGEQVALGLYFPLARAWREIEGTG